MVVFSMLYFYMTFFFFFFFDSCTLPLLFGLFGIELSYIDRKKPE